MGLLDDAIREHLDLKRRRGADPTEVEQAEREALGPVRRNREAPVASESDDDQDAAGIAYDQAGDENWSYDEADERLAERERDWRRRKEQLDAMAAAVILQEFLDHIPRS